MTKPTTPTPLGSEERAPVREDDMSWIDIAVLRNGAVIANASEGWLPFLEDLHVEDNFSCVVDHPDEPGYYRWTGFKIGQWDEGEGCVATGGMFARQSFASPATGREEVARLVDPRAWHWHDLQIEEAGGERMVGRANALRKSAAEYVEISLEKADAILALLAKRPPAEVALADVAAERDRQITVEGWTTEHDDQHDCGEMAMAAALYASPRPLHEVSQNDGSITWSDPWPWERRYYLGREQAGDLMAGSAPDGDGRQKHDRRRQLVIAGALIVAEIERLDRAGGRDGDADA